MASQHKQCAPSFSNPNQKVHELFHFYYVTVPNQLKKTSVIGLSKFTIVNMAEIYHKYASFSIENLFFEDHSVGSLMSDSFLD